MSAAMHTWANADRKCGDCGRDLVWGREQDVVNDSFYPPRIFEVWFAHCACGAHYDWSTRVDGNS